MILEMQELVLPEQHTLILDGLPRSYAQAERLDRILDVIQIFHLKIVDTVWRRNGCGRGPCAKTGSTT